MLSSRALRAADNSARRVRPDSMLSSRALRTSSWNGAEGTERERNCSGVGVSGVCTRTVRPQQQLLSQSEFIIWGRHTEREVKPSLQ
jgi:hypothetical protein